MSVAGKNLRIFRDLNGNIEFHQKEPIAVDGDGALLRGVPSGLLDSKIMKAMRWRTSKLSNGSCSSVCLISVGVRPPVAFTGGDGISVESDISGKNLKETELNCTYPHLASPASLGAVRMAKGMNRKITSG